MKYFNKYNFYARYIPGLIALIPLSILYFFITVKYNSYSLDKYFSSLTFLAGLSATFIIGYFTSMVVRELGSFLEHRYFKKRLEFPTNYLLLFSNDKLTSQIKEKFGERIKTDFDITRFNSDEELENKNEALKILNQASKLISTKYQQNTQVKEANIAYGFSRNVSGGLILGIPFSIAGFVTGISIGENILAIWSVVILVTFCLIAIFHKRWIINNAEKYAEKLIAVYIGDR